MPKKEINKWLNCFTCSPKGSSTAIRIEQDSNDDPVQLTPSSCVPEIQVAPIITTLKGWNKYRQIQAHSVRENIIITADSSLDSFDNPEIVYKSIPSTYDCDRNLLIRVGGQDGNTDGGKWICGEYLRKRNTGEAPNIVFSVGSNGDFSFEESMIEYLGDNVKIFTFDCNF